MAWTDRTEKGLETMIVSWLVEENGYEEGQNGDYNMEFALDENRLFRFLQATQPEKMKLILESGSRKRRELLSRLSREVQKNGVIHLLRNGFSFYPAGDLDLFYHTPREGNDQSKILYEKNIFSVTRQLRYSPDAKKLALDVCLFINGLPVITMELKNSLTGQHTEDAVEQYKKDRDPKDLLFSFKRCMAHFAVDDQTVKFCTQLKGKDSWFLPFNKGYHDGAGNPPNPNGVKTDYLWKDIFTKEKLSRILENYAQVVVDVDPRTKKKTERQIWPRYHQLDCVEKLLSDVQEKGVGHRYLIQHSAGSGKSNSIAWLAHQLIGLEKDSRPMIDSVIVVTDRRVLDRQIKDTIRQFMQVKSTVVHANHSGQLKKSIEDGKRIIISTIEKFPYISQSIGMDHVGRRLAIIIDEAHSGQSGRNAANMNLALSGKASDKNKDFEDQINDMVEGRRLVENASYFAFTATPKNKTEEVFGTPYEEDGKKKFRAFHVYTMKQAIQEGFILDVLKNYTTIDSWYKIVKKVEEDPLFDKKRAGKKLRAFVEGKPEVVSKKAELMVDHFHEQIIAKKKLRGQSRAMVVTPSIARCVEYYYAITHCLEARKSPYKAIIAFSGEYEKEGKTLTSAEINQFADSEIPEKLKKDPYRILIAANMFQTGFDEPLLQTMYVDKPLYGVAAVQTLSRLNRAYPGKDEVYVLDFANKAEDIEKAFSKYYRTTILSGETDPNKLYDLISIMEEFQVYSADDVEDVVRRFLGGAERDALDPILDQCRENYLALDTDDQIQFKSAAKSFVRTYGFLGSILPYGNVEWEKLSIFLNLLLPKLPAPREEDLSEGILSTVDLESYRNEARQAVAIQLPDEDAEIAPVPAGGTAHKADPEMETLSQIVSEFNDLFGNIEWKDKDNVEKQILHLAEKVSRTEAYQNAMKNSDEQEARTEGELALKKEMFSMMKDCMELYRQFQGNRDFSKWLKDMVFHCTYNKEGKPYTVSEDKLRAVMYPEVHTSYGTSGRPVVLVADSAKGQPD